MKTKFIAAAVAATLGLGSVSAAFAQDRHGNRGWQQQQHVQNYRGDWNHRYVQPAPARAWGYNNAPVYRDRRDGGDMLGALVIGGILGAALGSAANNNYYSAPPATYYPQQPYYTQPAPYYNPGYGYGYGYPAY